MDAEEIIKRLGLEPHPGEGGFYRETYRSKEIISADALPERYGADRNLGTAIYYMLTPKSFSALHRIKSDEVFHFYLGDPVTMLQIHPDGHAESLFLGPDIMNGQLLQVVVPAGVWQGMYLNKGGNFALMGTTVAPGFDFDDFELADRKALLDKYPNFKILIEKLTV